MSALTGTVDFNKNLMSTCTESYGGKQCSLPFPTAVTSVFILPHSHTGSLTLQQQAAVHVVADVHVALRLLLQSRYFTCVDISLRGT